MNSLATEPKSCKNCGSSFMPKYPQRINCDDCLNMYGLEFLQRKARSEWAKQHRAFMRANARKWEAANPDKVKDQRQRKYARHCEAIKAKQRAYTKTDKGRMVRAINNYKRRKRITEGNVPYDYLIQLKLSTDICVLCNKKMNDVIGSPLRKSIDHIVPLCIGGKHEESNLRCICVRCNTLRPKDGSDI